MTPAAAQAPTLPPARLFATREARLAALDGLARAQWLGSLTHSQGWLEPRLAALAELRQNLSEGRGPKPDAQDWPPPAVAAAVAAAFAELDLARYCHGQAELTDTVLMSLLFQLDLIVDYIDRGASEADALAMAMQAFREDWRNIAARSTNWWRSSAWCPTTASTAAGTNCAAC
jgi:hypothetical protein